MTTRLSPIVRTVRERTALFVPFTSSAFRQDCPQQRALSMPASRRANPIGRLSRNRSGPARGPEQIVGYFDRLGPRNALPPPSRRFPDGRRPGPELGEILLFGCALLMIVLVSWFLWDAPHPPSLAPAFVPSPGPA